LGADLAYMGTAFIATTESRADEEYKQMVVEAGRSDLILSSAFTGADAWYLRQSIIRAGLDPDALSAKDKMDLSNSEQQVKAWKDIWSAGQGVGIVDCIQTTAERISQFKQQYNTAIY